MRNPARTQHCRAPRDDSRSPVLAVLPALAARLVVAYAMAQILGVLLA